MQYYLGPFGQHCIKFQLCNVVPRVLRQNWTERFLIQCCLELLGEHCIRFSPVQCYPKLIKTIFHTIFFKQYSLEALGQHCIGFWPAYFCQKSINTTFHRISSYVKLCGASRITLHRVLAWAMLSQEY